MVQRLGRGFGECLHRPASAGENFGGGNQAVSFTLHGLSFSHARQTNSDGGGQCSGTGNRAKSNWLFSKVNQDVLATYGDVNRAVERLSELEKLPHRRRSNGVSIGGNAAWRVRQSTGSDANL